MAAELSIGNAFTAGAWLLAAITAWYAYRMYVVRSHFQRLQRQGVVSCHKFAFAMSFCTLY